MPAGLVKNAELAQQIADVGLSRALGEPQSASDSCVGQPPFTCYGCAMRIGTCRGSNQR
jgi:hypothetical protein